MRPGLRLFAIALLLLVLPAPRCIEAGVMPAAGPCVRTGLTKELRTELPHTGAALAILKHVLARDELWPVGEGQLAAGVRKNIVAILEDPELVIEYSAPLVPEAHLEGKPVAAGQTLNRNRIRVSKFAGKDTYTLARTLLHELVHVEQLRYEGKPEGLTDWLRTVPVIWEKPAYAAEAALPRGPFDTATEKDVPCYDEPPQPPCPEKVKSSKLCPWSPKGASSGPCDPGFCFDGGFNHSLACKQENQNVPNAHPTDLNDLVCNDGFRSQVRDRCSGVLLRCE
ncbi:MAG: hypothetical protein HY908_27640 [Myxococcales bacterium]|nr:hypothetical protein [Myxococcales bacterium]